MPTSASTNFVKTLYSTVLLRSASTADIAGWGGFLDSYGYTDQIREEVTANIVSSAEARTYVDPIVRLYQGFFDRAPDVAGLAGWTDALRDGSMTLTEIAQGFVGSTEFKTIFGADPSPTDFVTALYQNILGRAPDAPGLASWVSAIATGQLSFAQVALGFTQSPEYIADSTAAIDNWFTIANATTETGSAPLYQSGPIAGAVPGPHSFALTFGANGTTGSGLGGDTVYAPVMTFTLGGATSQAQTLGGGTVIALAGSGNTLDASLFAGTGAAPTISGVATLNLTNADPAAVTATLFAGKITGVTTINDLNSVGTLVVGAPGQELLTAPTNISVVNAAAPVGFFTIDIATAALAGPGDTLNIGLVAPSTTNPMATVVNVGSSGNQGYENFVITATGSNTLFLSPNTVGVNDDNPSSATTIVIGGTGNLTLAGGTGTDGTPWAGLTTIDASANTGGVSVIGALGVGLGVGGITALASGLTTVKGGTGDDTFDLSTMTTEQLNAMTALDGGGGNNTIELSGAVVEGGALTKIASFEKIVDVDPGSGGGIVDWTNMGSTANILVFTGKAQSAPMVIDNAPDGFALNEENLGTASDGVAINGPGGTADNLSILLGTVTTPPIADAGGAVTVTGFETITVTPRGTMVSDGLAGLSATASAGGSETLIVGGPFVMDFSGPVVLSGATTTISVTDPWGVFFNDTVTAQSLIATADAGAIFMHGPDLFVSGVTGDTIVGAPTAANVLFGSVGNDIITGGQGDSIFTVGGGDTITLGTPGEPDLVNIGTVDLNDNPVPGAIVAADGHDSAQPGYWGVAPGSAPRAELAFVANTGTSLDQSVVTNFQAGSASAADSVAFYVSEWGTTTADLGLVSGDLTTPVPGASFGQNMTPGVVHAGGTVSAATTLIELTDMTFANANSVVAALHGGLYGIKFAVPLAAATDTAHVLVAYNDTTGNVHIADLDITGATSASSTALTLRASDMVELVGISLQSLQPSNVVFFK